MTKVLYEKDRKEKDDLFSNMFLNYVYVHQYFVNCQAVAIILSARLVWGFVSSLPIQLVDLYGKFEFSVPLSCSFLAVSSKSYIATKYGLNIQFSPFVLCSSANVLTS